MISVNLITQIFATLTISGILGFAAGYVQLTFMDWMEKP